MSTDLISFDPPTRPRWELSAFYRRRECGSALPKILQLVSGGAAILFLTQEMVFIAALKTRVWKVQQSTKEGVMSSGASRRTSWRR